MYRQEEKLSNRKGCLKMKKTDTMKKSELNIAEMENVAGGTGPLGKTDNTNPLNHEPYEKTHGPLAPGPADITIPFNGTGPLNQTDPRIKA